MDSSDLERAFQRKCAMPFPLDSACDETGALHAELVLYDTTIAGIITTFIKTGEVRPEHVRLLKADPELRARLQSASESDCSTVAVDANQYLRYLDALEEVVQIAVRVLESKRS